MKQTVSALAFVAAFLLVGTPSAPVADLALPSSGDALAADNVLFSNQCPHRIMVTFRVLVTFPDGSTGFSQKMNSVVIGGSGGSSLVYKNAGEDLLLFQVAHLDVKRREVQNADDFIVVSDSGVYGKRMLAGGKRVTRWHETAWYMYEDTFNHIDIDFCGDPDDGDSVTLTL